jgi:hypothetical protein
LLELGREAGDVKQQIQLNFGLPLNRRTLLKNLNPVSSLRLSAESDLYRPAAQMTPPASTAVAISKPLQNTTLTNSLRGNASLHALHAKM